MVIAAVSGKWAARTGTTDGQNPHTEGEARRLIRILRPSVLRLIRPTYRFGHRMRESSLEIENANPRGPHRDAHHL